MALPPRRSSILSLPLSPSLIHHLKPDPLLPSPASLFALSASNPGPGCRPSDLRRSRPVHAAFSFVTPLPLQFPYPVNPATIEAHLAALEPSPLHPLTPLTPPSDPAAVTPLGLTSPARTAHFALAPPKLVHLSPLAARQCLPNLDPGKEHSPERAELLRVLSAQVVPAFIPLHSALPDTKDLASLDNGNDLIRAIGFAPWSLCYAGHQFGQFAGQLGDGRAITIFATPSTPAELEKAFNLSPTTNLPAIPQVELQLKGAGRTPFSRFADGLAVLRSSVREYLASEACHALPDFPTSRALALVKLGATTVQRERLEPGALVCRLAPSWLRVGCFEAFRWREDWAGLAQLAAYAAQALFGIPPQSHPSTEPAALQLLREVVHRNARMVAAWQAWGFMHGVINTDNISILGLTIDYGPFAFMDIFSRSHICNHSDELGRYSYANQPAMVRYALTKLAESLVELVGFQLSNQSQSSQETFEEAVSKRGSELKETGTSAVQEVVCEFDELFRLHYETLMRKRLGLVTSEPGDFKELVEPLLDLMAGQLDYSLTLRAIHALPYPLPAELDVFIGKLESHRAPCDGGGRVRGGKREEEWKEWITRFVSRLERELNLTGRSIMAWRREVCGMNPRFVLRQWILEELIEKIEKEEEGEEGGIEEVYRLVREPFVGFESCEMSELEKSNRNDDCNDDDDNSKNGKERLFGIGPEKLIGFKCSCSS